ncbi:N-acetyl-D-Glu racemase DgcA [Luteimonas terricola]|uniref:Dipeptide epimerase n=1 Tax=Luteimonas terricola TaxID=645597 RepID=A0ABQ2EP65_9GAMM|nr:N-acetyl-D-Glu racemase DgcA [Luteimonas terricola]GGK14788.1 dipeptide epimerase [Luteimonas terricola]
MLNLAHASHPLATPFRISRGVRTSTEVVVATIRRGGFTGRGEALPYARYGESVASVIEGASLLSPAIAGGLDRRGLCELLSPGAARNALDCALWDLESRQQGTPVSALLGQPGALPPLASAQTVSLDTPERMAEAARALARLELVKIKVDASDPAAQIRAVRGALPGARLIVDPNESWTLELLESLQPVLAEARIDLVEQPLPAGGDDALSGFSSVARLCADESCHTASDLPRLRGRYQVVNIKLDKTGGLTGALELLDAARAQGFGIMVGCMISSSLAIAPAWHIARHAEFVDLDGPLWLKDDHAGGAVMRDGLLQPPAPELWGGGARVEDAQPA